MPRLVIVFALLLSVVVTGCSRIGLDRSDETRKPELSGQDAAVDASVDVSDGGVDFDGTSDTGTAGTCGDGVVNVGESCDDGDANDDVAPDACRTDCTFARCGDGVIDTGEVCDDGNATPWDGCDSACRATADACVACDVDADCGRAIDVCLGLIDGSFCVPACRTDEDCPGGTTCRPARAGGDLVCIPVENVCAGCFDEDGDGYGVGVECLGPDCRDDAPRINPGVDEICDDLDNDCDGLNDEGCPPDLIVDAEEVILSGDQLFDRVEVRNGGVLRVDRFTGDPGDVSSGGGTGCLDLTARVVHIRPDGTVNANGAGGGGRGTGQDAGWDGGISLANTGPAGGGHGGRGGAGEGLPGGATYGNVDGPEIDQGSNGGAFRIVAGGLGDACAELQGRVTRGGIGGGCVAFRAPRIIVEGQIRADGTNGENSTEGPRLGVVDGGGGGSGGGIVLEGRTVEVTSTAALTASGGAGGRGGTFDPPGGGDSCIGNGGGGGGGGRIKVLGDTVRVDGVIRANAGTSARGPQSDARPASPGTIAID